MKKRRSMSIFKIIKTDILNDKGGIMLKKGKTSITTYHKRILAFIGIAGVLATGFGWASSSLEKHIIQPYINRTIQCQYDSLHAPAEKQLKDVSYDTKVIRNIMELTVSPEVLQAAVEKTNDTIQIWRVR